MVPWLVQVVVLLVGEHPWLIGPVRLTRLLVSPTMLVKSSDCQVSFRLPATLRLAPLLFHVLPSWTLCTAMLGLHPVCLGHPCDVAWRLSGCPSLRRTCRPAFRCFGCGLRLKSSYYFGRGCFRMLPPVFRYRHIAVPTLRCGFDAGHKDVVV